MVKLNVDFSHITQIVASNIILPEWQSEWMNEKEKDR